jgi:2-aminoethylphosphonate-pyruvate transaminase
MTTASHPDTAARWASDRAIDLWLAFTDPTLLDMAAADGATVVAVEHASPFAIFECMRRAGIDDVRRVGVAAASAEALDAARRAGVGAVVGIAQTAARRDALRAAEPDAVVPPDALGALDAKRWSRARQLRRQVLLNPGPALTTERVKRAAAGVDLCHREPEYRALEDGVRAKLRAVAGVGDDWQVALVAGSGTAADELCVQAAVRPGRALLVLRNGVYGDRLHSMAERAGLPVRSIQRDWTTSVGAADVDAALAADPEIDAVALVHHETTTGLLNPLADIAAVTRRAGVRLLVDAVSSFGAEPIRLAGSGIDLLACSSNKCLHGLPGVAFVLASPAGCARAAEVPAQSVYLDLATYVERARGGSVPFTPAVPALVALDAALDELLERGLSAHQEAYRARAAVLDAAFERLGLEPLLPAELRSSSIRSVRLPPGIEFSRLHDELKADGYVIYAGQGRLAREVFRVSCMGALEPPALEGFAKRLEQAIATTAVA